MKLQNTKKIHNKFMSNTFELREVLHNKFVFAVVAGKSCGSHKANACLLCRGLQQTSQPEAGSQATIQQNNQPMNDLCSTKHANKKHTRAGRAKQIADNNCCRLENVLVRFLAVHCVWLHA